MSEDFGKAVGAPSRITLGGVDYVVAKQGPRIYGELQQFIKSFVPDPRVKAKEIIAGLPDAVALEIWREYSEEAKDWPLSLDSAAGNLILTTTQEGARQVVWSLLRRHNGSLTREKADEIADDLTMEQVSELIRLSMPEGAFDPKSPEPGTTTDPA
jgi:hypothetical protein